MRGLAFAFFFVAALLGLAACTQPTEPAAEPSAGLNLPQGIGEPAAPAADETSGAPRLRLRVEPERGRMPLLVRFEAELLGAIDDPESFECPTLAWTTDSRDDGEVVIAQATGCREGEVQRRFALEHAYLRAQVYEASVRLVARDVPPSNLVQILVEGPTATPAAQVALPGPTIVVATPGRPLPTRTPNPTSETASAGTSESADSATEGEPGLEAGIPSETLVAAGGDDATEATPDRPAASRPTPSTSSGSSGRARILPADLYFLGGQPLSLWRLSASGGPPEFIIDEQGAGGPIEAYAVSRNRVLALVADGALRLGTADDNAARASAVITQAAATDLHWTRDGRRLTFSAAGVWVYDQRGRQQRRLLDEGRPLAWSRDGRKLLAQGPGGELVLIDVDAMPTQVTALPIEGIRAAGFFPDRDVAWLADTAGSLKLLSLFGNFTLKTVDFEAEVGQVNAVFVRPDRKLLALSTLSGIAEASLLDLEEGDLRARAYGVPIAWSDADALAWAPDGRLAAAAGPNGLRLLDPGAGSEVPLLRRPAAQPHWILSRP